MTDRPRHSAADEQAATAQAAREQAATAQATTEQATTERAAAEHAGQERSAGPAAEQRPAGSPAAGATAAGDAASADADNAPGAAGAGQAFSWKLAAVLLVGLAVLGAAAGFVIDRVRGPQFEASSVVQVQATPSSALAILISGNSEAVNPGDLVDVTNLATTSTVLGAAAKQLTAAGTPTSADELSAAVTAEAVEASHLVTITASTASADLSQTYARAVADALAAEQQRQVAATLRAVPAATDAAGDDQSNGADSAAAVRVRAGLLEGNLVPIKRVSDDPAVQTVPGNTLPLALGVVGLAAGALIAIGLSLGRRRLPAPAPADGTGR